MTTAEAFLGSVPELIALQAFERAGLTEGIDFTYQSRFMGGRTQLGGVIVDFLFSNPSGLAINVQGVYYHYEQGSKVTGRDQMARIQLAGLGIQLIFIDEDDLLRDPDFYISEALGFRDHSRMAR